MSLRCLLGFHRWTCWYTQHGRLYMRRPDGTRQTRLMTTDYLRCARCGRLTLRDRDAPEWEDEHA